jgi:hypothetical protein
MKPVLAAIMALTAISVAFSAEIQLKTSAPRVFAGRQIVRQFHVSGDKELTLAWQNRVFSGIVDEGRITIRPPSDISIPLNAPDVRARVRLDQEMVLFPEGGLPATEEIFPLEIYPDTILSDFAKSWGDHAPIGVVDPFETVLPVLESAGIPCKRLHSSLGWDRFDGNVVLIAPGVLPPGLSRTEKLLKRDRTLVFLDRTTPWESGDIDVRPMRPEAVPLAAPLASGHPLFLDIGETDWANWGGSGQVASHPLEWTDCPGRMVWLATKVMESPSPLLIEVWSDAGRAVFCQLDVAGQLQTEPVAQILLRNLIVHAWTTPPPHLVKVTRYAVPSEAVVDAKFREDRFIRNPTDAQIASAVALIFTPEALDGTASLARLLESGQTVIIQSLFPNEVLAATNSLVTSLSDRQTIPVPHPFAPVAANATAPPSIDRTNPLVWGIPEPQLASTYAEETSFTALSVSAPGAQILTTPAIIAKCSVGKGRLILCRMPLNGRASAEAARIVEQILSNIVLQETSAPPTKRH